MNKTRSITLALAALLSAVAQAQAPGGPPPAAGGAPGAGAPGTPGAGAPRAGGPGGGGGADPAATIQQMMTNNDANKDGTITKEEATKANLRLIAAWDTYDLNKDGKVDAPELTKALAAQPAGVAGGPGAGAPGGGAPGGAARGPGAPAPGAAPAAPPAR